MKLFTPSEASQWKVSHAIAAPELRQSFRDIHRHVFRFKNPQHGGKYYWFACLIEEACRPWAQCLLTIEEWGVWESSENWHLYYSLCKQFDEARAIEEACSMLFVQGEQDALITFVQVFISMGWDFSILTADDKIRVFVSHDEWTCFSMRLEADADLALQRVKQYNLHVLE